MIRKCPNVFGIFRERKSEGRTADFNPDRVTVTGLHNVAVYRWGRTPTQKNEKDRGKHTGSTSHL